MKILFFPKEANQNEARVALVPESVTKLQSLGAEVWVESGLGSKIGYEDQAYRTAGARIAVTADEALAKAEIVLTLQRPSPQLLALMRPRQMVIAHLDPFQGGDYLQELRTRGLSALAMEFIPRSTIAQKMDALSSQANLSGYVAVLQAAQHLPKVIPMMMTPAGTIRPARFFVVGVGVAGLQAIATAKRLGARVDAFDTRPVVEEQVKSLGAKFLKIDLGETGQTKDGYAQALTEQQIDRQRQAMSKQCAQSDVVITTAQVFGRRAPILITQSMIQEMRPGSVIVDAAVEQGGNVEGSVAGEVIVAHGVTIIGLRNLPGRVAADASLMYASNLVNLIGHFWDKERQGFQLKLEDDIIKSALLTHGGELVHDGLRQRLAQQERGAT